MKNPVVVLLLLFGLLGCRQQPTRAGPSEAPDEANSVATAPNADINASLETVAEAPSHTGSTPRFIGTWAPTASQCANSAWRFTETALQTPSSECRFNDVREVPGGYDIAASCTVGRAAPRDDVLRLRFAESIGGLLVESEALIDVGMIRCSN